VSELFVANLVARVGMLPSVYCLLCAVVRFDTIVGAMTAAPAMETSPAPDDSIRKRLNLNSEKDEDLIRLANQEQAVLLCAVAPYRSVRLSPVDEIWASIGLHEEFAIEAIIEDVASLQQPVKKLMLLLNTPGGGLHSSYKVAKALRKAFDEIEVYVPHMAASGGTLISLTGNKIVMGPMSQLSPVDPQVVYRNRRVSALFVRHAFNRISKLFETKTKEEAPYPHQALADKLDPILMEVDSAAVNTAHQYVRKILDLAQYDEETAQEIAGMLIFGYPDHDSDIDYEGAEGLGIRVERHDASSRNLKVWRLMRSWLGKYLYAESGTHTIRYVFPESVTGQAGHANEA
jgi:hypothetical protein